MTRFLLIVLMGVFLGACKPGVPKDVVQPEVMEKILFDIHVLDGYTSEIPTPDSAKKVTSPIYKGIFKKYGTDSAKHAKSMSYYYAHPDLLTKIYDHISRRLEKARDVEMKKQQKAEAAKEAASLKKELAEKKVDSIEKAKKVKQVDTAKKVIKKIRKLGRTLPPVKA